MCLLGMQPAVNGLGRASEPCAWSPFYPDLESGSRVNCGEGRLFVQGLSVWSRPARLVLEFHRIVLCKTVAISSPFGVECTWKLLVIHLRLPRTYATVLFFNVVVPASVRTCDDSCLCLERKSYLSFVALWY